MADTYDLGSYVVRHAGSSPVIRTKQARGGKTSPCLFFKKVRTPTHLNATRTSVATQGSTETNLDSIKSCRPSAKRRCLSVNPLSTVLTSNTQFAIITLLESSHFTEQYLLGCAAPAVRLFAFWTRNTRWFQWF